jgi:hypothetical protein
MNGVLSFAQWAKSSSINENVKAAKSYLIKRYADQHKIEEVTPEVEQKAIDNKEYNQIRELLKGNDGYVYPFIKFHFEQKIPIAGPDTVRLTLKNMYTKIKDHSGMLNTLPMTIEQYSNTPTVGNISGFESLMDEFDRYDLRKKHKWVIEKVNGDLRRSIKQMDKEQINRLYAAAKIIDDIDAESGKEYKDTQQVSILKKSNAFKDGLVYLNALESTADGLSNSDVNQKINELRAIEPEAGLIYAGQGYLVISVRTQEAQLELFKIVDSTWCLNYSRSHKSYGGKLGYLQYNIFNFNLPVTNQLYIVGNTIDSENRLANSHQMNDDPIKKSSNLAEHLQILGYPSELIDQVIKSLSTERQIKTIVEQLGLETAKPIDLLSTIVKSTYRIDLDVEENIRTAIIGIIKGNLSKKLNREEILELYMKVGVISTFSARLLNILIPNLSNEEQVKLLNKNDQLINDPTRGFKYMLSNFGRSAYPQVAKAVDDEFKIKDIIISGESIG